MADVIIAFRMGRLTMAPAGRLVNDGYAFPPTLGKLNLAGQYIPTPKRLLT